MSELMFDGSSGRRPQSEARSYVYRVLVAMLDHEITTDANEWMFGGVENEPDQRRIKKAIRAVQAELRRKP